MTGIVKYALIFMVALSVLSILYSNFFSVKKIPWSTLTPPVISYPIYPSTSPSPSPSPYLSPDAVLPTLVSWIAANMKPENKSNLDEVLLKPEENGSRVITVKKYGTRDFATVLAAIESIPSRNTHRITIWIGGGYYFEKINIIKTKNFITLFGDPVDTPRIVFNGTAAVYGTVNSATVAVDSDYFMAVNIVFVNSAPMPDGRREWPQAVALRISGTKASFYNCKFIGFQDTLCDHRGIHFFKDCYIEGTVDFIFGNGKSLYLNTTIHSVAKYPCYITAQGREEVEDDTGFTFMYCTITGTINNTTYLGRAWRQSARVIYAYTYMDTVVHSEGWSTDPHPESSKTVYYGEYMCEGPGASSIGRVGYAKILSKPEAEPFLSITSINGSNWLLPPPTLRV